MSAVRRPWLVWIIFILYVIGTLLLLFGESAREKIPQ